MKSRIIIACLLNLAVAQTLDASDAERRKTQQTFKALEERLGIHTPLNRMRNRAPGGQQGTQEQFNTARSQLNALLSKDHISPQDEQTIKTKIQEFSRLNPARWPFPNSYTALLQRRLDRQRKTTAAGAGPAAQPSPAPSAPAPVAPRTLDIGTNFVALPLYKSFQAWKEQYAAIDPQHPEAMVAYDTLNEQTAQKILAEIEAAQLIPEQLGVVLAEFDGFLKATQVRLTQLMKDKKDLLKNQAQDRLAAGAGDGQMHQKHWGAIATLLKDNRANAYNNWPQAARDQVDEAGAQIPQGTLLHAMLSAIYTRYDQLAPADRQKLVNDFDTLVTFLVQPAALSETQKNKVRQFINAWFTELAARQQVEEILKAKLQ